MKFDIFQSLKRIGAFFLVLTASLLLSGCSMFDDEREELKYVLSIHPYSEAGVTERMKRDVEVADGEKVTISRIHLLNSKSIKEVVSVRLKNGGGYGLVLRLDHRGALRWQMENARFNGMPLIVTADGKVVNNAPIIYGADESELFVPGPFTKEKAEAIAAKSARNYEILNPRL